MSYRLYGFLLVRTVCNELNASVFQSAEPHESNRIFDIRYQLLCNQKNHTLIFCCLLRQL